MALLFKGQRAPDSGSLAGDILVLRHIETGDVPFTADSAEIAINGPGGLVTPAPIVTIAPGGISITHVLQALINEVTAGPYNIVWKMTADGQTMIRGEQYFVTWTDVYTQIRSLLRLDDTVVTNYDIDLCLLQIMSSLLQTDIFQESLVAYSAIPTIDAQPFDRALSLMVAAFLRPFLPKQTPSGAVTSFASGTDKYTWQPDLRKPTGRTIEEQWLDMAWQVLTSTTVFGNAIRLYQARSVAFRASGRRRNQMQVYMIDAFGQPYMNPAFALWSNWLSYGGKMDWSWGGGFI